MEIVLTKDGSWTARHPECDQEFHSLDGAWLESEQLYIRSSGILERFSKEDCSVLDIGMGLGFNVLTTIDHWLKTPDAKNLVVVSLEKDPVLVEHLTKQTGPWQANWSERWKDISGVIENNCCDLRHPNRKAVLQWKIHTTEASSDAHWDQNIKFDYFWQDPFSLPNNPELWTAVWFQRLKLCANPDAALMTYSVARNIKDALTSAGWDWELIPTSTRKRHWLRAKNRIE